MGALTEAEKEVLRHKAANAFLVAAQEEASGKEEIDWKAMYQYTKEQGYADSRRAEAAELVARTAHALFWYQDTAPRDPDGCIKFDADDTIITLLRNAYILATEDFEEARHRETGWRPLSFKICTCERDKKEEAEAKCSCS